MGSPTRHDQAIPLPDKGGIARQRIRNLLQSAQATMGDLMVDRELDDDTRVVFCIPCLKRDQQLMAALAINCVLWWPMRKYWRIAVCTFGEDASLCVMM